MFIALHTTATVSIALMEREEGEEFVIEALDLDAMPGEDCVWGFATCEDRQRAWELFDEFVRDFGGK